MTRPRKAVIASLPPMSVTDWNAEDLIPGVRLGRWSFNAEFVGDLVEAASLHREMFLPLVKMIQASDPIDVILGSKQGKAFVVGVSETLRTGLYVVSTRLVGTGALRRKR